MKTKEGLLGGVGIGVALTLVLGAVSLFVRSGWPGLGLPRGLASAARLRDAAHSRPADLPSDFEEQCRLAGL